MRLSFFILLTLVFNSLNAQTVLPGAERMDLYSDIFKNKNIAIVCNQTSVVGNIHLVDTLLSLGVHIKKIMAPEHGFRGNADAGAKVKSGVDSKTGISILSLYGQSKKPSKKDLEGIDMMVFDIQDVGVRFYTYISTLQYIMEACGEYGIPLIILDRPNPNGHYVDGPILEAKYKSFVGMQPIPVVYGMTIGEYAQMLVGEKWLSDTSLNPIMTIIPCENYTHHSKINLPIPPSPNLKTSQAIALYPSLCLFEGTNVSVGRGTETPFELFGSPQLGVYSFAFTPVSMPGASHPPFLNQNCFGKNLSQITPPDSFDIRFLIEAYQNWMGNKSDFFLKNLFFDKLAGNSTLRWQIIKGKMEREIRQSWQPALIKFKEIRKKYLLYPD